MKNALVLTGGSYQEGAAKTAHGLVRGTSRFQIVGVLDSAAAGKDAGTLLDGKPRNIPILNSLEDFLETYPQTPVHYLIVGVAVLGGKLPAEMRNTIATGIEKGISIVSGLHEYLNDDPIFYKLARQYSVELIDVRKPKPFHQLHSWSGEILKVGCPRIAVLGTDMGLGKRTTTKFLTDALNQAGTKAEMIYTGQTGWMQGFKYGFILDSTLNDFVSGEMEHAIVHCWEEAKPDVMLLEGQSSLRNPAGPCGAEYLLSAGAKGVILQHAPGRTYFRHQDKLGNKIPPLASEIELIRFYGAEVLAVTFNTLGLTETEMKNYQKEYEQVLGLPVVLPREEGVEALVPVMQRFIKKSV
jgi:uncharacterized NAD-dependent epimerase/dehydratase family protein